MSADDEKPRKSSKARKWLTWGIILVGVIGAAVLAFITVVVPRLQRARMDKAVSDIKNADIAFTYVLMDPRNVMRPLSLFVDPDSLVKSTFEETIKAQTAVCYDLLKYGRDAQVGLKPEVQAKLGSSYFDIPKDPWGNDYQFFLGPLRGAVNMYTFRLYRGPSYVYDMAAYEAEKERDPYCPRPETDSPPSRGFPCSPHLSVYIYSFGANGKPDQLPQGGDGGDDINNWDNKAGWKCLYYPPQPSE
jgi:hypothetical protein